MKKKPNCYEPIIIFQQNGKVKEVRTESYNVGTHVLVSYDDGSAYCKSDMHPFKYANGMLVEVGNNFIVVKDSGKDVYIEFDWVCAIQDGSLPINESHIVMK